MHLNIFALLMCCWWNNSYFIFGYFLVICLLWLWLSEWNTRGLQQQFCKWFYLDSFSRVCFTGLFALPLENEVWQVIIYIIINELLVGDVRGMQSTFLKATFFFVFLMFPKRKFIAFSDFFFHSTLVSIRSIFFDYFFFVPLSVIYKLRYIHMHLFFFFCSWFAFVKATIGLI